MKNYITFDIGCHFGCAIVNNDYSGLTDKEEKQLNQFLNYLKNEYKTTDLIMDSFEKEPNFVLCEISNLMDMCNQFTLEITK
jgi:hypothetical protein